MVYQVENKGHGGMSGQRQDHNARIQGRRIVADIRNYPPPLYAGIVVLTLPRHATVAFILHLVDHLLHQPVVLARLPGRLAIVEPGRIRLRPS